MHKNYNVTKEKLIEIAKENDWTYYEIVECNYEYSNGLLLIGYYDEECTAEIAHICMDMDGDND